MKSVVFIFLSIMGSFVYAKPSSTLDEHILHGYTQGTTYHIKYYGTPKIVKREIDSLLHIIDLSMSVYNKESIISTFNDPKTKKIKMDLHMEKVITASFKTFDRTDGYFDITIMPLVNLWGFGPHGFKNKPSYKEIAEAKSRVSMHYIKQKGPYLTKKRKGVSIDVNGIAQGYTVDVLGDYLTSRGINNYIIEVGGEIVAKGSKPNGDFIVEIQRPYQLQEGTPYRIKLKNKAITTSGTYEKQIEIDGKLVSHHIDPKTGFPIENSTLSVTVIANTALEADAIDNYLMFLKPTDAIQFVENQKYLEAYVIYVENNVFKELRSSGFNNYIYNVTN